MWHEKKKKGTMTKVYEGSEIQFKGCRGGPWEKRKVTS